MTLSGYLYKRGDKGIKTWKKRFFALKTQPEELHYSVDDKLNSKVLGKIVVSSITQVQRGNPDNIMLEKGMKPTNAFQVDVPGRSYYLYAEIQSDAERWCNALSKLIKRRNSLKGREDRESCARDIEVVREHEISSGSLKDLMKFSAGSMPPPTSLVDEEENSMGDSEQFDSTYDPSNPREQMLTNVNFSDASLKSSSPQESLLRNADSSLFTSETRRGLPEDGKIAASFPHSSVWGPSREPSSGAQKFVSLQKKHNTHNDQSDSLISSSYTPSAITTSNPPRPAGVGDKRWQPFNSNRLTSNILRTPSSPSATSTGASTSSSSSSHITSHSSSNAILHSTSHPPPMLVPGRCTADIVMGSDKNRSPRGTVSGQSEWRSNSSNSAPSPKELQEIEEMHNKMKTMEQAVVRLEEQIAQEKEQKANLRSLLIQLLQKRGISIPDSHIIASKPTNELKESIESKLLGPLEQLTLEAGSMKHASLEPTPPEPSQQLDSNQFKDTELAEEPNAQKVSSEDHDNEKGKTAEDKEAAVLEGDQEQSKESAEKEIVEQKPVDTAITHPVPPNTTEEIVAQDSVTPPSTT